MITIVEWREKHDKLKRLYQLWSKENTRNPREIDFYTKELFYFKCNNGHKCKARPYNAIKNKNQCTYCKKTYLVFLTYNINQKPSINYLLGPIILIYMNSIIMF